MPELRITIPEDLDQRLQTAMPEYLDRKGFVCLLLDQALDTAFTLGGPSAAGTPSISSSNSSSKKKILNTVSLLQRVPEELSSHHDLILEFWKAKKGSKGETAFSLLIDNLSRLHGKYGAQVVEEQLKLGINGRWQSVTLKNYEQFKAPKGNTSAQPEHKHPAARVFQGGRFVDEPVTNSALEGLL